ncbi:MAG: DMT family transporter [Anaerolineae bacterium]|nr:DMT family transporter [Anaerolineae bacterium]
MTEGSGLAAISFGLAASLSWGTSDFSGGLAAKRAHIFAVMVGSYTMGLILLFALAMGRTEAMPAARDLVWAGIAGLAGSVGLTAQYRALAVGRMGIAAPIAAVLGAAVPVMFSAITEGMPGTLQIAGFGVALLGVWLIARAQSGADSADQASAQPDARRGLGLAVIAGLGFGFFFILIDRVSSEAIFWPLIAARGTSLLMLLIIAQASRSQWQPPRAALPVILLAGVLDVGGNTFFVLAAQSGRLDVATVVSSLYPAMTVLLARAMLKEEIARVQGLGIMAALVAILLIAA